MAIQPVQLFAIQPKFTTQVDASPSIDLGDRVLDAIAKLNTETTNSRNEIEAAKNDPMVIASQDEMAKLHVKVEKHIVNMTLANSLAKQGIRSVETIIKS